MPAANSRRSQGSYAPKSSASWLRSAWRRASQFLRKSDKITAARAELRGEHADAGAVAQFVNLVEQVDDVEAHGEEFVVRRPLEVVRHARVHHGIGRRVQGIGHDTIG